MYRWKQELPVGLRVLLIVDARPRTPPARECKQTREPRGEHAYSNSMGTVVSAKNSPTTWDVSAEQIWARRETVLCWLSGQLLVCR